MMKGFFNISQIAISKTTSSIPRCGQCGMYKGCKAPKMAPTGKGRKKILLVGEASGRTEDEYVDPDTGQKGKQFIGDCGLFLRDVFENYGIDVDRDCLVTNALLCRPPKNKRPSNPNPVIEACRPNLLKTIKDFDPNVIILLGATACKSLIPVIWTNDVGTAGRWGSWQIPSQVLNAWVCPTFHPAYILRNPGPTMELKFKQDIKAAVQLEGKPWKKVPCYQDMVEVIYNPKDAAKAIRSIVKEAIEKDLPIAADYETTCLKPEYKGAEIVSCALSIGPTRSISYPWVGESIEATKDMWESPTRKIASNLKFEDRWTRKILGIQINKWYWDTMIAAHILDNREDICSIKFQAFVLLGTKSWNEHITPYLSAPKGQHLNRIKELDMKDLLVYGGMDALQEWLVAKKQIKMMERIIHD
jgi:uracil-DNA glycosylase family 4